MAGRDTGGSERAGKVSRTRQEEKQRKLVVENIGGKEKKVTFKIGEERLGKEERQRIIEEVKVIVKEEVKVWKEEKETVREEIKGLKEIIKECEKKISRLEERTTELENWEKAGIEEGGTSGEGSEREDGRSIYSYRSGRSSVTGRSSGGSRLSDREVDKIKRWVVEKDREERRCNIIIKGVRVPEGARKDRKEGKEWAAALIKEKIGVECGVVGCRESGTVVIVKLENEEAKKEIMRNKFKLKGDRIYIENDLSWEERKIQEKINKWAKGQKEKGLEVKVGVGRVRVRGIWRPWAEMEREEEEKEMGGREKEKKGEEREEREKGDRERAGQNFV